MIIFFDYPSSIHISYPPLNKTIHKTIPSHPSLPILPSTYGAGLKSRETKHDSSKVQPLPTLDMHPLEDDLLGDALHLDEDVIERDLRLIVLEVVLLGTAVIRP